MYERHHAIEHAIGVFQEEQDAFDLFSLLCWLLPLVVVFASFIDCLLILLYHTTLHPWKRILIKVRNNNKATKMSQLSKC